MNTYLTPGTLAIGKSQALSALTPPAFSHHPALLSTHPSSRLSQIKPHLTMSSSTISQDTQAILAVLVVLVVFGLFIWSKARKKSGGCGGCGCDHQHDHAAHDHDHDHAKH